MVIIRYSLVAALALTLTACGGGFDDMDAARPGGGISSNVTSGGGKDSVNSGSNKGDWKYGSGSENGNVFITNADNFSLNTFPDSQYPNLQQRPWIKIQRQASFNGGVLETVTIFAGEKVSCTPTCNVRILFGANARDYLMITSIDSVLKPANDVVNQELFKKFTTENSAEITIPYATGKRFDARFNLKGYDEKRMGVTLGK